MTAKKHSRTKEHLILTAEEREARWQALTLADDFLFSKIMADPVLCRELLHRIFPNLEITELSTVQGQKTVKLAYTCEVFALTCSLLWQEISLT